MVAHGDLSKFLAARLECLAHPPLVQDSVSVQKRTAFLIFDEAATIHGIASGIVYLHQCCVIHGDIKAANILLGDSLTSLPCDFGLAKNDKRNVTSPWMKGSRTARRKSPGLNNEKLRTTKRDIYALGMTIVENETGTGNSTDHGDGSGNFQRHHDDTCKSLVETAGIYKKRVDRTMMAHCRWRGQEMQGHYCTSLSEAALIYKEPEDRSMIVHCLKSIGDVKETQGHYDSAYTSLSEAVSMYKAVGDQIRMAQCLQSIGVIKESQGDYSHACSLLINAFKAFGGICDQCVTAHHLKSIGDIKNTMTVPSFC
ncbi:hypothetical protein FRB93_008021 [Tulasnella sp. JGI-2019a]|nr:hypothetical protein FRB93_008021 [Tulasnella sp. JGI-2019a]